MVEDASDVCRPASVLRAVGIHGPETEAEFYTRPLFVLFQCAITMTPLAVLAGATIGAAFTSGVGRWVLAAFAATLVWPTLIGLAGTLRVVAGMRFVALVYKDRLLVQWGTDYQEVLWDDVEAVYIRTQVNNAEGRVFYDTQNQSTVWIKLEMSLVKFWMEWTEVRTRDGLAIRLPSTVPFYDNLSELVQAAVSSRKYPGVVEDVRAGRAVKFGPLVVSTRELVIDEYTVNWSEHGTTWSEGGLLVTVASSGARLGPPIPNERVPNLAVVTDLIIRIRRGEFSPVGDEG